MDKKKKVMIMVGILALGGVAYYMYSKKKAGQVGGGASGGATSKVAQCQGGEPSKGKGTGVFISIASNPDKKTARELANTLYKVGTMVSVDGGTPTKVTKVWRDKSKNIGALKLANGVANGSKICLA
tara:strand:- start:326 stop:706 length:381 start_codon:yes stop_codon:yes gene_type:complete